jgi:hypothetical protein
MNKHQSNREEQPRIGKTSPPESQNGYQKKVSELIINTVHQPGQESPEDNSPGWGVHSPLKRSKPKAEDLFEYEE